MLELFRSRLAMLGRAAPRMPGETLAIDANESRCAHHDLEAEGVVLRGWSSKGPEAWDLGPGSQAASHKPQAPEWCDRRLLARIHRATLQRLRAEIQPITPADFMRFLFEWQ